MNDGEYRHLWEAPRWPQLTYDTARLAPALAEITRAQGFLLGRLADVGIGLREQASLAALTEDVVKTSAIEGEMLNVESVRSSIARRLGVDIGGVVPVDRHIEGIVDLVLDITSNSSAPLTTARLFGWHAALFPTGYSGMNRISVGQWRNDERGPMQVVSGSLGQQKVHFEAPPAECLAAEIAAFLDWANADSGEPDLIKAGIAHLWFVTLHPFDDGNGRIAQAVGDLFLARADGSAEQRFYSLSAQIQRERNDYYAMLERTQRQGTDVTEWLAWSLATLGRAIESAQSNLDAAIGKAHFWQRWNGAALNERQVKQVNRLLDGFEEKITTSKWSAITKCSQDTALRDITALVDLGLLKKSPGGGRSTGYELT